MWFYFGCWGLDVVLLLQRAPSKDAGRSSAATITSGSTCAYTRVKQLGSTTHEHLNKLALHISRLLLLQRVIFEATVTDSRIGSARPRVFPFLVFVPLSSLCRYTTFSYLSLAMFLTLLCDERRRPQATGAEMGPRQEEINKQDFRQTVPCTDTYHRELSG